MYLLMHIYIYEIGEVELFLFSLIFSFSCMLLKTYWPVLATTKIAQLNTDKNNSKNLIKLNFQATNEKIAYWICFLAVWKAMWENLLSLLLPVSGPVHLKPKNTNKLKQACKKGLQYDCIVTLLRWSHGSYCGDPVVWAGCFSSILSSWCLSCCTAGDKMASSST